MRGAGAGAGALLLALAACAGAQNMNKKTSPEWDMLIFTQHWPVTVCQEWKETSETHTCSLPSKRDAWSIHGIWPTKAKTIGPAYCNRTWHFDPEQVRPIEEELKQLWINIEKESTEYALWTHEWNKHGTCAAVLEPLSSQLKYFTQGMNWLKNYTMSDILSSGGIVPSPDREYMAIDIFQAIKNKLGKDPVIECRKDKGISYLFELRICFDKKLNLNDCDIISTSVRVQIGDVSIITNCDPSKGILYPPTVVKYTPPNALFVQIYKLVTWLQWFTL